MKSNSLIDDIYHKTRIGKFVSVGAIGALIETSILAVLITSFGTAPLIAKAIGAEFSISTMFVINDKWTFINKGNNGGVAVTRRWMKSHLVRIVGLSIGFLSLFLLTSKFHFSILLLGAELWPILANLLSIGVGIVFNYIAESVFTWNVG
jgi:putative flippase GtrA